MTEPALPTSNSPAGALRLALRPDLGGSIAGLWHDDLPVLRSTEPEALERRASGGLLPAAAVLQPAGLPALPLARQGPHDAAEFRRQPALGARHRLAAAWTLESARDHDAVLHLVHAGDADWPFAFEARQAFSLTDGGAEPRPGDHQTGAAAGAGRARLAPVLPEALAQPAAHRADRALGSPTPPACRRAACRRPASTATWRTSTSTTASRAGAARPACATRSCRCA